MNDYPTPAENVFRVVDGRYMHNNEEISKAEFDRRKAETDNAMGAMRGSGQRSKPMTMQERKAKSFSDMEGLKKGGKIKKMASGGKVSSASKRADGCITKGKTKGKMV
jgi:hypothetical protein